MKLQTKTSTYLILLVFIIAISSLVFFAVQPGFFQTQLGGQQSAVFSERDLLEGEWQTINTASTNEVALHARPLERATLSFDMQMPDDELAYPTGPQALGIFSLYGGESEFSQYRLSLQLMNEYQKREDLNGDGDLTDDLMGADECGPLDEVCQVTWFKGMLMAEIQGLANFPNHPREFWVSNGERVTSQNEKDSSWALKNSPVNFEPGKTYHVEVNYGTHLYVNDPPSDPRNQVVNMEVSVTEVQAGSVVQGGQTPPSIAKFLTAYTTGDFLPGDIRIGFGDRIDCTNIPDALADVTYSNVEVIGFYGVAKEQSDACVPPAEEAPQPDLDGITNPDAGVVGGGSTQPFEAISLQGMQPNSGYADLSFTPTNATDEIKAKVDRDGNGDYFTIQDALESVESGRIAVSAGLYQVEEELIIPSKVTLAGGYDRTFTIQDPARYHTTIITEKPGVLVSLGGEEAVVDGVIIEGGDICIQNKQRVGMITRNVLRDCNVGVLIGGPLSYTQVVNNTIYKSQFGIVIEDQAAGVIINNIIKETLIGISNRKLGTAGVNTSSCTEYLPVVPCNTSQVTNETAEGSRAFEFNNALTCGSLSLSVSGIQGGSTFPIIPIIELSTRKFPAIDGSLVIRNINQGGQDMLEIEHSVNNKLYPPGKTTIPITWDVSKTYVFSINWGGGSAEVKLDNAAIHQASYQNIFLPDQLILGVEQTSGILGTEEETEPIIMNFSNINMTGGSTAECASSAEG